MIGNEFDVREEDGTWKPPGVLTAVGKESTDVIEECDQSNETTQESTHLRAHGQGPVWWMEIWNADGVERELSIPDNLFRKLMVYLSVEAPNDLPSSTVLPPTCKNFFPIKRRGTGWGWVWDYKHSHLEGGTVKTQMGCQSFLHLFHQAISPLGVHSRELLCMSEVSASVKQEREREKKPSPSAENWLNTLYYSYTTESYCSHQKRMVCFFMYCHRETIEIYY